MNPQLGRHLLRAKDLAYARYAEPLDVAAMAARAHVSPTHFTRSFKEAYGGTPYQYLLARRLERAMFFLRETDRSVTDICFDVGFASLGTFTTTFKRVVGETPSAYRSHAEPVDVPGCLRMVVLKKPGRRGA